jgi:hypothetical protein
MCDTTRELYLPWTKLKEVTTDGAADRIGKETALMGRIRRGKDKENPKLYIELHCIIYQQSLCGKSLKFMSRKS